MPSDKTKASTDNPFAQAMNQAMNQAKSAAEDFSRMFGTMKFPGLPDGEAMLGTYRRNMEALAAANRIALEGAQTVARRHMEIMQQSMTEMAATMQALAAGGNPQAQADLLKQSYERAVANISELSELIQRANHEALEQLNRRFTEAMEEVKRLMDKAR